MKYIMAGNQITSMKQMTLDLKMDDFFTIIL